MIFYFSEYYSLILRNIKSFHANYYNLSFFLQQRVHADVNTKRITHTRYKLFPRTFLSIFCDEI